MHRARADVLPSPPRPPWALTEAAFTARCTRCGACERACPRALIRSGGGGFPQIDVAQQGCDFCRACIDACEPRALDATRPAFTTRVIIAPHCLNQQRVECRACSDACDARALRFTPAIGGIAQLVVDLAACTGCGACVAPCPVGAISLGLPTQGLG